MQVRVPACVNSQITHAEVQAELIHLNRRELQCVIVMQAEVDAPLYTECSQTGICCSCQP